MVFSGPRKGIILSIDQLRDDRTKLQSFCQIRVGGSQHTNLWSNIWIESHLLSSHFSCIFFIYQLYDVQVVDRCDNPKFPF